MNALDEKLKKLSEEDLSNVYKRVFNTDDGLLVLEDLKNRCFSKSSTIESTVIDPYAMACNEGKRQVILTIETQLLPYEEPPRSLMED